MLTLVPCLVRELEDGSPLDVAGERVIVEVIVEVVCRVVTAHATLAAVEQ